MLDEESAISGKQNQDDFSDFYHFREGDSLSHVQVISFINHSDDGKLETIEQDDDQSQDLFYSDEGSDDGNEAAFSASQQLFALNSKTRTR